MLLLTHLIATGSVIRTYFMDHSTTRLPVRVGVKAMHSSFFGGVGGASFNWLSLFKRQNLFTVRRLRRLSGHRCRREFGIAIMSRGVWSRFASSVNEGTPPSANIPASSSPVLQTHYPRRGLASTRHWFHLPTTVPAVVRPHVVAYGLASSMWSDSLRFVHLRCFPAVGGEPSAGRLITVTVDRWAVLSSPFSFFVIWPPCTPGSGCLPCSHI